MSNIREGAGLDPGADQQELRVRYVSRDGQLLGEHFHTRSTIEEARRIPIGNRLPFLPREDWRLHSISSDGKVWTIDQTNG